MSRGKGKEGDWLQRRITVYQSELRLHLKNGVSNLEGIAAADVLFVDPDLGDRGLACDGGHCFPDLCSVWFLPGGKILMYQIVNTR